MLNLLNPKRDIGTELLDTNVLTAKMYTFIQNPEFMISQNLRKMREDLLPEHLNVKRAELEARKDNSSGKGCWYEIYSDECVLCGSGDINRERRYGPKPEITYHHVQHACPEHFM